MRYPIALLFVLSFGLKALAAAPTATPAPTPSPTASPSPNTTGAAALPGARPSDSPEIAGKPPCWDDIQKFCAKVAKGGGAISKCLKKNEAQLSESCKDQMARVAVKMKELHQKFSGIKAACNNDVDKLCKTVPLGKGQKMKCLQDNLANPEMSEGCKAEFAKLKP